MTAEDAFVADILEHPDDDAPRLILADWLEDRGGPGDPERAEFIRLQCRRAHLQSGSAEDLRLRQRAEKLLQAHWNDWVRPLARLVGSSHSEGWLQGGYHPEALYKFRRGFIYVLDMLARQFIDHAEEILRWAPLRQVRLFGAGSVAQQFAACPQLRWFSRIDFIDYFSDPVDAKGMKALAASPWLGALRGLGLFRNDLADAGLTALAGAKWIDNLLVLELGENGISPPGIQALAANHSFRPQRLLLGANPIGDEGAQALAESPIVSRLSTLILSGCNIGPVGATALARSPWLKSLRYLHLDNNPIGEGAFELAEAPWLKRLSGLHVENCSIGELGRRALREALPPG